MLGGLGSFPLVLMVAAFLQSVQHNGEKDEAQLFLQFLNYFGQLFNNEEMAVREDGMEMCEWKEEALEQGLLTDLFVQDPFRKGVNVASSVTRFGEIKECFSAVCEKLMELNAGAYQYSTLSIIETAFDAASAFA